MAGFILAAAGKLTKYLDEGGVTAQVEPVTPIRPSPTKKPTILKLDSDVSLVCPAFFMSAMIDTFQPVAQTERAVSPWDGVPTKARGADEDEDGDV